MNLTPDFIQCESSISFLMYEYDTDERVNTDTDVLRDMVPLVA